MTFLAFSTEVVDLSDHVGDPLALLLEISVGGGTDIARAMQVARGRVRVPSRTMVVLISDFEEGGSPANLVAHVGALHDSGVKLLGCAALDDTGVARYNVAIAGQVAAAGMAVSALSPTQLARWVAEQVNR
ncbi:MAG: VWA domain-containing protein [Propionibacteriaceae bacterium]|nr:VWA domain-containing protein [Propionibacteriaceae bacterium]